MNSARPNAAQAGGYPADGYPDARGRYGAFGGRYVPETLVPALDRLQAGVERFLFSSSCSLYGAAGSGGVGEDAEMFPVTPYGQSKVDAERELTVLADDNFSPVYLRNATAYGASTRLRLDIVVNNLTAIALTTGKVHLQSDGTPWRPIVHIRDIMAAMVAALQAPREAVHNQVFNVGVTEENYRISELADIVREVVPGSRVEYAAGGGPDKRCYRVSCEKIRRVLPGFHPQWNARKGAQELFEAYRSAGLTAVEVDSGRYTRIMRIQELMKSDMLDASLAGGEPILE